MRVDDPRGEPSNPFSKEEVEAYFEAIENIDEKVRKAEQNISNINQIISFRLAQKHRLTEPEMQATFHKEPEKNMSEWTH